MYGNETLIDFSKFIIAISFGSFLFKYYKEKIWSFPLLSGALFGIIILIPSLLWRKNHKNR